MTKRRASCHHRCSGLRLLCHPYPPHHRLTAVPPASRAPASSTPGPDVVPPSTLPSASPSTPLQPASENTLLIENARLKAEVTKLKTEVKVILDHSIESDQRLLQFTDTIFTSSKSVTPLKKSCTNYVNASAQTEELPGDSENNIGLEKEIQDLKRPCRECTTLREETKKMIASIRYLEEENKTLVQEITRSNIVVSNNYEALEDLGKKKRRRKKKTRKPKLQNTTFNNQQIINTCHKKESKIPPHITTSTVSVAFRAVTIEGDSHARFMAGMVQRRLCSASASLEPDCWVWLRGVDLLPREARMTSEPVGRLPTTSKLENQITMRTRTAKVMVLTVPYRHDLPPSHLVNQETTCVNNYIRELCIRCKGSVLLDFKAIGRRHFTRHGHHLTMRGKRMLAELVVGGLKKASLVTADQSPSPSPLSPSPQTASITAVAAAVTAVTASVTDVESPKITVTEPAVDVAVSCVPLSPDGSWTLPYNSYAEAVKSPPLMTNGRSADLVQAGIGSVFLGPHFESADKINY
ncbi:hypothetical protein J6590_061498 [Homalodisca vitripennis]|nr:hypothetical protein J6590_061498 [Homalodisca vitripennis]